jgi:hypothetical protein
VRKVGTYSARESSVHSLHRGKVSPQCEIQVIVILLRDVHQHRIKHSL